MSKKQLNRDRLELLTSKIYSGRD